jgi:collagenase-like PrtC family protease
MEQLEVLAPGGSLEAIATAIEHGADAIYVGVGDLNARVRAGNLDPGQLRRVVACAHEHQVRIHVALNVPMTAATLRAGLETMAIAWLCGADALILRDPLLVRVARDCLPGIAIHISTQAGVHNVTTATRFHRSGADRIILARECSLAQIRAIHEALPDLELESFVFGALCFAVSGQCLLGEAIGGRSGNYGNCLQACRLPFFDGKQEPLGHLLSMKDLNYLPRVRELAEAGIISLKIEGRMKSPAWVGCLTHWTRRAAMARDKGGLSHEELQTFRSEVSTLFARPMTDCYLDGKTDADELISSSAPGHRGLKVAFHTVVAGRSTVIELTPPVPLSLRDGLLVTHVDKSGRERQTGVSIRRLMTAAGDPIAISDAGRPVRIVVPGRGRLKTVAIHSCQHISRRYKGGEPRLERCLQEGFGLPLVRNVSLQPKLLTLTARQGRCSLVSSYPVECQEARNAGFDAKTGNRIFPGATIESAPGLYLSPSSLKEIRRKVVAEFEEHRVTVLAALTDKLEITAASEKNLFLPSDEKLLQTHPAAVSRVTGLENRNINTSGGDNLVVESSRTGTVIRQRPHTSKLKKS